MSGWEHREERVSTYMPSKTPVSRFSRLKQYPTDFDKQNQVYVHLSQTITEILYYEQTRASPNLKEVFNCCL